MRMAPRNRTRSRAVPAAARRPLAFTPCPFSRSRCCVRWSIEPLDSRARRPSRRMREAWAAGSASVTSAAQRAAAAWVPIVAGLAWIKNRLPPPNL